MEPVALVAAAFAAGVRRFSITDHDNLAAPRELAATSGAIPTGLELLPGVEINTFTDGAIGGWRGELHILGLGVDPSDEAFEVLLAAQRERRRDRYERTLTQLRLAGMPIDDVAAELPQDERAALGRPTVGRLLMAKGYVTSVDDAFARIIAYGMPGYVPRDGVGPLDAITAIRAAGGLPVLAHTADAWARESAIRELRNAGLGGIEVHYRRYDQETVTSVGAVARRLRLVPTGGTDYHGDRETYAQAHADTWVPMTDAEAVRTALDTPPMQND